METKSKRKSVITLPLKIGSGSTPITLELAVTKTKPKTAEKNVVSLSIGGEEFYVVASKTTLK